MTIFIVNCGSSSIKYRLYNIDNNKKAGDCLAEGMVERIGTTNAKSKYKGFKRLASAGENFTETKEYVQETSIQNHEEALSLVLQNILHKNHGVIGKVEDVKIVGHRMVHGGDKFTGTMLLCNDVKKKVQDCCKFAPLHNPVNLLGLEACQKLFPNATQAGTFDTAFHSTIPEHAYLYAIPYSLYEKHTLRRYGFHGSSHKYVANRCIELAKQNNRKANKIIICHLGNGASISAIKDGISVDTSMGFTPLEGLIMGSRSGDVDPGLILALHNIEGMSFGDIDNMLNKKSGFMGITEETSDSLVVEIKALEGSKRHRLALDMFNYRVKKYIGSYAAAIGGVDAIIFTGGIGENSAVIREEVCVDLEFLGVDFDKTVNNKRSGQERYITKNTSKTDVLVIPTNEELQIASECLEICIKEAKL